MGALVLKGVWRRDTEEMEELAGARKQGGGKTLALQRCFFPHQQGGIGKRLCEG